MTQQIRTRAEYDAEYRRLLAAKRLLAIGNARESLTDFIKVMMPDPEDPDNAGKSRYAETPQGSYLCRIIEETAAGKRQRTAVSMPPQHGKPVAEHELVWMADGSRKPLRDVEVGDRVITHEGRSQPVEKVFVQGEIDTLRIRTATGREVVAAPDHPFLTPRGWVQAGSLRIGDSLAVVPESRFDSEDGDPVVARLLGYFVGDGCTTKNGATIGASITCVDAIERKDILECASRLGFGARIVESRGRASSVHLSGGVRSFLRAHGLVGKGSAQKRVPEWVFTAGDNAVAHFLGAYFACDGSVNGRGGARKDVCLEFYSVSEGLLRDVQHLLTRVGVQARLSRKSATYKGQPHASWRLGITSQTFAYRFATVVPVFHEKADRLREWELVPTEFSARYMKDQVTDIESSGKYPCRCLSVREDHSFVAADFVVHNTLHLSTMGPAWLLGKFPDQPIIVATYNETRAGELGEEMLSVLQNPAYQSVFPGVELSKGSKSKTSMRTTKGGRVFFVGRGGTITGRAARFFIVDDPLKDDEEAQSDGLREKLWTWFYSVAYTRGSNKTSIIVLHTRWHEDDLIGRLADPDHPERDQRFKGISDRWDYVNLPAVVSSSEMAAKLGLNLERPTAPHVIQQFGDRPMSALWSAERGLDFLAQWRQGDARTFDALAMGKPSPEEGVYFLAHQLATYEAHELPRRLRKFGASDHAVSERQRRDYTIIGSVGVDEAADLWVMPDLLWKRIETDKTVEELIHQFRTHRPELWFMEDELISKSFGPFLRERMRQEGTYVTLSPIRPAKDKETRARAAQGRVALKTVHFPRFAWWWPKARAQLLRFPNAANDDFVDWLSAICLGLLRLHGPGREAVTANRNAPPGSIRWILEQSRRRAATETRRAASADW